MMRLIFLFLIAISASALGEPDAVVTAPTQAAAPTFEAGVKLYQEQHFAEAFDTFKSVYSAGRDFAALHYNWGLAAYKLQKKGLAIGLWRRALYLDPELAPASSALELAAHEMPRNWNEEVSTWNKLRADILDRVSLNKLAIATWLFLSIGGFLFVRYVSQRLRAFRNEEPLPPFPIVASVLAGLFVVMAALSVAKLVAMNEIDATVITATTPIRTGPSVEDNAIFDLLEGFEVLVRSTQKGWVQVSLKSGQVGWVPAESLFQNTGRQKLW